MNQVYVRFDSAQQIVDFINIISYVDADMDLESGKECVNAKSLLGVMSLDFSKTLRLRYNNSLDKEVWKKLTPFMQKKECCRG